MVVIDPTTEKLLTQLRAVSEACIWLERAIISLELKPPNLYHSTLLSLTAKRGVLMAQVGSVEVPVESARF
jgi:hypothetical protein